jgi:hypothetical protein
MKTAQRLSHLVAGLVLLTAWPAAAAPEAPPAGTAVTVHGQSTVSRQDATSAPLRTRDPVFVRDRVGTAANSLVRLLLGGKALITLRESSVVTITDTPEHSAITLREGRLALGLAPSKLRPGDVVEVRTPNAVAGVRGSFLVAETHTVNGVVETVFSALQVHVPITVTFTNRGNPTMLGINQRVSVTGVGAAASMSPVRSLSAAEVRQTAAVSTAPSLTGRDTEAPSGLLDQVLSDPSARGAQYRTEVPRRDSVRVRNSAPPSEPPGAGGNPPAQPPPVVQPPPFEPPPVVQPPPFVPPPVVELPPPFVPPPVVPPPTGLRGLERAQQVAAPSGDPGRANAVNRGNR